MYAMRSWLPAFGALGGVAGVPQAIGNAQPPAVMAAFPQFMTTAGYPQHGRQLPDWLALLARLAPELQPEGLPANVPGGEGGDFSWQGLGP